MAEDKKTTTTEEKAKAKRTIKKAPAKKVAAEKKPAAKKSAAKKVEKASDAKIAKPKKNVKLVEDIAWVLRSPIVTEKSALASEQGVYTFEVDSRANKILIKKAFSAIYDVNPVKVTIVNAKPRTEIRRGRQRHVKGVKKAMVFVEKGQVVELI